MSAVATETTVTRIDAPATQVQELRGLARRALKRMYLPNKGLFAFCLRRGRDGDALEGISRRYTAIALIGLAEEDEPTCSDILHGSSAIELCGRLLDHVPESDNVGDVALTLWSAIALNHDRADKARERLCELRPWECDCPTVELAWALTAFSIDPDFTHASEAQRIAQRLLATFVESSDLFSHRPFGAKVSWSRAHVCCYADLVYPIQALSHYYLRTNDRKAIDVAKRCTERMCSLQGPAGQWWWHYDARNGKVLEEFPVYAIHQDAMGPMALLDLQSACGVENRHALEQSLKWLTHSPEINGTLIDQEAGVVWRKVARHEPGKLVRSVQAVASRAHPALRVPLVGRLFRPGWVDRESRPYHFGWLLYAWAPRRFKP